MVIAIDVLSEKNRDYRNGKAVWMNTLPSCQALYLLTVRAARLNIYISEADMTHVS